MDDRWIKILMGLSDLRASSPKETNKAFNYSAAIKPTINRDAAKPRQEMVVGHRPKENRSCISEPFLSTYSFLKRFFYSGSR
jgi:hypothetical protein